MRLVAFVEYDGTDFHGWAAQPGKRTVESELTKALATILRHPVKLSVAGRTDTGVHASGQVVSFDSDAGMEPDEIAYRATAVLPKDAAVRRCIAVSNNFDARRDAKSRSYEYRVDNSRIRPAIGRSYTAYVVRKLDVEKLREVAATLVGTHDFTAFTPTNSYHIRFERDVSISRWETDGDLHTYHITADSFMYGMVRTLVGTMFEVANGTRDAASFARLLEGGDRRDAGPTAPAKGLTLVRVGYDDLEL